ncbi:MAG: HDOD domain-containing protein [Nitrospirales bacterium]
MLSGFCNPFVFLGVSHVTEYWRRPDDDSWDSDGERTHENWMALSHAGEPLAPWSGSFSPRLLIRGQTSFDELQSRKLSHLDREVTVHVQAVAGDAGMIPVDLERALGIGVEVFLLSEGCEVESSCIVSLWRHSLRTGYLAALIAFHQGSNQRMVWQSFVGGVLHDIGMLVFLTQQPEAFTTVVEIAQCRGGNLAVLEREVLGYTHGESGATFLARWGLEDILLAIVAFHDDPSRVPHTTFGPLTAVYAANFVEGGGIAQDGDGVIGKEGEEYLTRLGLWDNLPIWQSWMPSIQQMAIQ